MKSILLDADGVVLKRQSYFSEKFSSEYGVPTESIIPFFKGEFRQCQIGAADLKVELVPYLETWGWKGTVDDFLAYWFESNTEVDSEVLDVVQTFRDQGVSCYLATDQERYRADYIQKKLREVLDGFYFSFELGVSKESPDFFVRILESLQCKPEDITYFDDDMKNVAAAHSVGITAHFYKEITDLQQLL